MKRSDIKMTITDRVKFLKKNRTRQQTQLKTDIATSVVSPYEANARLLAITENIELLQLCERQGMEFNDLKKMVETATKTSRGYEPGNLFADAD